jgi:cytosine/adenosine deaminase-related metal-dependent hydrolase
MHTFVECIGFTEAFAQARLDYSVGVLNEFTKQRNEYVNLNQSIIPHAPYSVSGPLFKLINEHAPQSLISIHNQESPSEDEYYLFKTGDVKKLLSRLGVNDDFFQPTGKSSLQSYLPYFSADHPLILVHNTCTSVSDISFAQKGGRKIFWCLCPNANQYIEQALPDVALLRAQAKNICIGTDSLASNHELSVLGELQTLKRHFPFLEWEELLRWGTLNGAEALQMNEAIGSFETGKKPGIIQLKNLEEGTAQRII